jgi:signal transduction histidine kinase
VGLSNRSAVEKMPPKVAFAKQKQLAQKTVGSRDHCTSRVCSGLVDGVAQGCNIRSPVALA